MDISKIMPMSKRIFVEILEAKPQTGGIIVPTGTDAPTEGKVIQCGADVDYCTCGDTLLLPKACGEGFKENDKEYRILEVNDILAIIQ